MPTRKNRSPEESKDRRLELADRLIEMMEKGDAHWQRPWVAGVIQPPINAVTGKPYRGVNSEFLFAFSPDPTEPRWCTYRQAQEQGWQVRKGEHALAFIEKYTPYDRKPTDEERQNRLAEGGDPDAPVQSISIRHYPVFHASQIDGIPPLDRPDPNHELEGKPDPRIEKLAEEMGVQVTRGGGRAFYRSATDRVNLPTVESFHTASGHDTTFLHELSHATGHESRLNRELGNPFGSEKYALEELRAEMSAAMTAASLGIGFDPASQELEEGRETVNSAAYLAGWLKALPDKDRKKILMQTIQDAQGISDYLIERTPERQAERRMDRVAEPALAVGDFVVTRERRFGADWDGRSIVTRIDDDEVRLRDIIRADGDWLVMAADRTFSREAFDQSLANRIAGVVPQDIAGGDLQTVAGRGRFLEAVRDRGGDLIHGEPRPEQIPEEVRGFLGNQQAGITQDLMRNGEEREFFAGKMREIQGIIRSMPETYGTDGLPDGERPVSLRYFGPNGAQWFIIEKDRGDPENEGPGFPRQTQAFGLADLGFGPEMGYISIPEITSAGAELDYHFSPRTLLEVKREHYPELVREGPTVSRGDYVRYLDEFGAEIEGVVLDPARPGEATRLRRVYRWPEGKPGMDGADHIMPTVLPDHLMEHIPGAVQPGLDLDTIDSLTDAYKGTMEMDDPRDRWRRAAHAVLMAVEAARGLPEQAAALPAAGAPERAIEHDLIAFLEMRNRIRQGEHPDFTGLSDPVANAVAFVERQGRTDPRRSAQWASDLQESPVAYGDAAGLSPATVGLIASQLDRGVRRMERPQVGDLVRFEPHDKDPLHGEPFSGRIIAALDTSGGDVRYHLRAETGPDKGMESTVYGKNGSFRLVGIEQAHGFDRNAPERLSPEQKAIEEYKAFYDQMPERADKLMAEARERAARLAPADFRGFSDLARDFNKGVDDVLGIICEGENRGASAPELHLAQALSRGSITDLPVVKSAREQSRLVGDRFRDLDTELREGFQDRLRRHGKELLKSGTLKEPCDMVLAAYWKHGIEATPESPMVDKLVTATQEKDLKTLMSWIGHNSQNPATEEAFTLLTNVPLGRTQKERVAQLEAWAGPERVEALRKGREDREKARAEQAPREAVRRTFDALTDLNVRLSQNSAKTMDGQEWIESKVAEGYTTVGNHKKGAITLRHLENPETGQTVWLKDSRFQSYCKAIQALEPSGDIVKAMVMAKIPLVEKSKENAPVREPEKAPEPKVPNPYEEKQKARQERYRLLAEKTRAKALARLDQARKMADIIPFGQPILVGHHSEHRDRRYRARIHDTFGNGFKLLDKADYYQGRAERVSNAISADDPEALKKLKEKLEGLKKSQEMMKAANAVIRKFQTPEERKAGLERIGFTRDQAEKVLKPDVMGTVGFPSYALSNNNANIRRIEERIKGLEKASSLEDRTTEFAWGKVRENKEINRIQFIFDGKPDNDVRDLMKKSGFRWAPSDGAWQRQWTGNAIYAAREAIKKLDEWYPASRNQEVPQPSTAPSPTLAPDRPAEHAEPGRAPGPAPTAAIRGRDGTRYALSLREKDGEVLAKLEIAGGETVEAALQPFRSAKIPDTEKLAARMELSDGRTLAVRLSPGDGAVEADLLSADSTFDKQAFTWKRLNDVPGKLRADGVDSTEAKWVAERLGVDAKAMLRPEIAAGIGAYRVPEKTREHVRGMNR